MKIETVGDLKDFMDMNVSDDTKVGYTDWMGNFVPLTEYDVMPKRTEGSAEKWLSLATFPVTNSELKRWM